MREIIVEFLRIVNLDTINGAIWESICDPLQWAESDPLSGDGSNRHFLVSTLEPGSVHFDGIFAHMNKRTVETVRQMGLS
jgi:hypothetical protein